MAIISDELECIFFHVPKTAGTSTRNLLKSYGRFVELATHTRPDEVRKHKNTKFSWDKYLKFAVIRNPFDRLYSIYSYYKMGHHVTLVVPDRLPDTFEKFVLNLDSCLKLLGLDYNQVDFINEEIDVFVRYEYLSEDMEKVFASLNKPLTHIPHERKSLRSKHYHEQYTRKMSSIVMEYFYKDVIKMHRDLGYNKFWFDTSINLNFS